MRRLEDELLHLVDILFSTNEIRRTRIGGFFEREGGGVSEVLSYIWATHIPPEAGRGEMAVGAARGLGERVPTCDVLGEAASGGLPISLRSFTIDSFIMWMLPDNLKKAFPWQLKYTGALPLPTATSTRYLYPLMGRSPSFCFSECAASP